MTELGVLALRTVITYVVVFLIMRFMGKREIGKLSVFDLVISFMIAEIAVIVIESPEKPLSYAVLPMVILMATQILISFLALKFRGLRNWFDGKPTILIAKGKLDREAMRKQRYNLDDLMLQLRENKIASVHDVEFAILETSGKLSIIERKPVGQQHRDPGEASPGSRVAFPKAYKFETLPIPLIMDGKVQHDNLRKIEKDRFWLKNELQQRGINDVKDVFLCTVDHKGEIYVNKRLGMK